MARRRNLAGITLYWVVARDESTTELVGSHSFVRMKEAELYMVDYAERRDPPGRVCEVKIEVLPTGELPKQFLK